MKLSHKIAILAGFLGLVVIVPIGVSAANVPFTQTSSATNIFQNSATLNGFVTPNGLDTYEWFEYGTSPSSLGTNGQTTNHLFLGSGNNQIPASATLQGFLTSNTTYYFRIVAQNQYGFSYGSILSFMAGQGVSNGAIPLVQTNAATNVSYSNATLNAQIDAQGSQTSYWFEYGMSTNFGSMSNTQSTGYVSGSQPVSISIQNLNNNSTYYFRAVAQNQYGTAYGSVLSFVAGQGGVNGNQPNVATLNPTSVTDTTASLNAQVTSSGSNATSLWFEYGTNSSYFGYTTNTNFVPNSSITIPSTQYVSNLIPGTTYYVRAVARNDYGVSYGQVITFTTTNSGGYNGGGLGQAPIVTTGSATGITEAGALLNGSAVMNGTTGTVWFEYGPTTSLGLRTNASLDTAGNYYNTYNTSYNYSSNYSSFAGNLTARATYYFRIVVQTPYGTAYGSISSFRTLGTVVVTPPAGNGGNVVPTTTGLSCLAMSASLDNPDALLSAFTYTVSYRNGCASALSGTTLTIVFPPEVDVTSIPLSLSNRDANSLTFDLGSLAPGTQSSIAIRGSVGSAIAKGTTLSFGSTISFKDSRGITQSVRVYTSGVTGVTGITQTGNSAPSFFGGASILDVLKYILGSWIVQLILIILVAFLIYVVFLKSRE